MFTESTESILPASLSPSCGSRRHKGGRKASASWSLNSKYLVLIPAYTHVDGLLLLHCHPGWSLYAPPSMGDCVGFPIRPRKLAALPRADGMMAGVAFSYSLVEDGMHPMPAWAVGLGNMELRRNYPPDLECVGGQIWNWNGRWS